jgi:2-succinyl-5-enolpyruvyl-6-hydroxy-3-cyclohexene-1-carboxylate synthase
MRLISLSARQLYATEVSRLNNHMKAYTCEANAQIVLALLRAHNIRKVVASPGATNVSLVGSMQSDPFFEMYSAVDERSAAYMACGLAAETGERVVLTCTGATAARNYLPGLTEAYYRKLPILAITSTQPVCRVGHLVAQVTDRSQKPKDTVKCSVALPVVKDDEDFWECECKVNQAILALTQNGGGPSHINLPTKYSERFDVTELPKCRAMLRIGQSDAMPEMPQGRVAVFIGSHLPWTSDQTEALDNFCRAHNGVVMCDHTSGYKGKFRVLSALLGGQRRFEKSSLAPDLLVHLGEVSGDYYGIQTTAKEIWRVSEDGEIRDTYRKLTKIFEMPEQAFFRHYAKNQQDPKTEYFDVWQSEIQKLRAAVDDPPFSNIWLASKLAHRIPVGSVVHFGILNSLRAWNFFELPESVTSFSNVGGFGIDGGLSSLIGAALADPNKLYFGVIGDLAFFYDMNSLGNRHVGRNIRILLVNNGKGTEFRLYGHHAHHFGEDGDDFIAAAGHFGNKSPVLVKHYAEDLGFEYFAAHDKTGAEKQFDRFLNPLMTDRPMIFEVFTNSEEESSALQKMLTMVDSPATAKSSIAKIAKNVLGVEGTKAVKKLLGR